MHSERKTPHTSGLRSRPQGPVHCTRGLDYGRILPADGLIPSPLTGSRRLILANVSEHGALRDNSAQMEIESENTQKKNLKKI